MALIDVARFCSYLVNQARKGDIRAARELAGYTAGFLQEGQPIPPDLQQWLLQGLKEIAAGKPADAALLTVPRRGSAHYRKEERDIRLTRQVERLVNGRSGRSPMAAEEAYEIVGKENELSDSAVKKVHLKWKSGVREDELLHWEHTEDQ